MNTQASHLSELPVEVLERIFLFLPGQDIIKIEAVCRHFLDILQHSPTLQHQRNIFSVGLCDNPNVSCDFSQRQRAYEEYTRKWSDAGRIVKSDHKLPLILSTEDHIITAIGWNLLACHGTRENTLGFIRVPPAASQKPIEWWSLPPLPFTIHLFVTYPPDGLLVVVQRKERSIGLNFLEISDGSRRHLPPQNPMEWFIPPGVNTAYAEDLAVTPSRVMLGVRYHEASADSNNWRILVWDWRTGDIVLELSSADKDRLIEPESRAIFLDEFRLMVYTPISAGKPFEFVFFNTENPQDNPKNPRRLRVPLKYSKGFVFTRVDPQVTFGRLNREDPLVIDPMQAFLTARFWGGESFEDILLILRTQTLIVHACSMSQDTYIPWDELGRDVMIAWFPLDSPLLVQGLHVITQKTCTVTDLGKKGLQISTFDFSLRGSSVLREGNIETLRADWHEYSQDFLLHGYSGRRPDWLGNDTFYTLHWFSDSGPELHVWQLT